MRFKKIWIHRAYTPLAGKASLYFLNHTSWWDGLIPFMLNEYHFKQDARAMMELKQMRRYPFFKWLGAFSIDTADRAHILRSLRYATQFLQQPQSGLYLYPEGEIRPERGSLHFKSGIGWLAKQNANLDFVPVGARIHTVRYSKPELHVWVGRAVEVDRSQPREKIKNYLQNKLAKILAKIDGTAGFDDALYQSFFGETT